MNNVLLEAKNISKKFNDRYVLNNVNLSVEKGHFITILGHSGSGKSTLLNILSSILTTTEGEVLYDEARVSDFSERQLSKLRKEKIGFVFQHYILLPNLTVKENILLGADNNPTDQEVEELCDFLGIKRHLNSYPYTLSGGEQQRVCIARAVIKKPDILFCDEATGALDKENSINIVSLLHRVKEKLGTTILFTTHNQEIAKTANRALVLEDGHIVKDYVNDVMVAPEDMAWGI